MHQPEIPRELSPGLARRAFLAGGAAASVSFNCDISFGQQPIPVIGYLGSRSAAGDADWVEAFRRGLSENGFTVGQNVQIEFRWAEGQADRLPAIAADLAGRRVSLIVAAGGSAGPAAKAATTTIPIVFSTGGDPVRLGLVASFSRPGGNLTGLTTLTRELEAKRFGLLQDLLPNVTTVGFLVDSKQPDADYEISVARQAARATGRELRMIDVRSDRDMERAFEEAARERTALVVGNGIAGRRGLIIALAARHGLPVVARVRDWAAAGCLISYGASFIDVYHQVGVYAGRVLKGANPADLPVIQPAKFELVINLNAAKALGLTVPNTLLAIADEVIE
jgi:putative ABC transport system substrate-binding protein